MPAISKRIFDGNNNGEGAKINLAGFGIGNGLTDPVVQYQYYAEMANFNSYGIKTVSDDVYVLCSFFSSLLPACMALPPHGTTLTIISIPSAPRLNPSSSIDTILR